MKVVSAKASLSKKAEEVLSSRDSAREVLKMVIEAQSSTKSRVLRIKSGAVISTEAPKVAPKA